MNTAEYDLPFKYCPELKEEYLIEIAQNMLKVVEDTTNTLSTQFDDNYTLETCIFGRMRQLFLALAKDASKPWVEVASPTMDYVPRICKIPFRVFKDDPTNPRKKKMFHRNDCENQQLSLLLEDEESSNASQISWRIFIQAPATIDNKGIELEDLEDDYRVVVMGYNAVTNAIVAKWQSDTTAKDTLHLVDNDLPTATTVTRQLIKPKQNDVASGNG
jgi:hypothetical protein